MMSSLRVLCRGSICSLLVLGGPVSSSALANDAPKTVSITSLQGLVTGLGFEDSGDKKTDVEIAGQGNLGVSIYFYPMDDGKTLSIGTNLGAIPKDKIDGMPTVKMLEFNNTHAFNFAIGDASEGKTLFLTGLVDGSTVTPQLLRRKIDVLVAATEEAADLWNQDSWKTAGATGESAKITAIKSADGKVTTCQARWTNGFSFLVSGDDMVISAASDTFKIADGDQVKGAWALDGGAPTSFASPAKAANTATITVPSTDENLKKIAAADHFDVTANGATVQYKLVDFYKAFLGVPKCVTANKTP